MIIITISCLWGNQTSLLQPPGVSSRLDVPETLPLGSIQEAQSTLNACFDAEECQLYSETLSSDQAPPPIVKAEPRRPVGKAHFCPLYWLSHHSVTTPAQAIAEVFHSHRFTGSLLLSLVNKTQRYLSSLTYSTNIYLDKSDVVQHGFAFIKKPNEIILMLKRWNCSTRKVCMKIKCSWICYFWILNRLFMQKAVASVSLHISVRR